eukprot:6462762-Amphidinium_carterae.2
MVLAQGERDAARCAGVGVATRCSISLASKRTSSSCKVPRFKFISVPLCSVGSGAARASSSGRELSPGGGVCADSDLALAHECGSTALNFLFAALDSRVACGSGRKLGSILTVRGGIW